GTTAVPTLPPRPPARRRARRGLWAAAGLAFLGLAGGLLALFLWRPEPPKGALGIEPGAAVVQVLVKRGGKPPGPLRTDESRSLQLPAGDYEVVLVGGDKELRLSADRVTLRPGVRETVTVLKPPSYELQLVQEFVGHDRHVGAVALSPDAKLALTAEFALIRVWDVESGKELRRFELHTGDVQEMVFSPDGKRVLSVSRDGTARVC